MNKRLSLTLLLGLTMVAAAQERLVIATVAEASDLDPRITFDTYSDQRMYAVTGPLLGYGLDLGLEPRLAAGWAFSEDGRAITFRLREGVLFHHGRAFTAENVKYTFQGGANYSRYANPRVDALLEQGRRAPPDSEASVAIYQETQAIVVEDAPSAHIYYTHLLHASTIRKSACTDPLSAGGRFTPTALRPSRT